MIRDDIDTRFGLISNRVLAVDRHFAEALRSAELQYFMISVHLENPVPAERHGSGSGSFLPTLPVVRPSLRADGDNLRLGGAATHGARVNSMRGPRDIEGNPSAAFTPFGRRETILELKDLHCPKLRVCVRDLPSAFGRLRGHGCSRAQGHTNQDEEQSRFTGHSGATQRGCRTRGTHMMMPPRFSLIGRAHLSLP